MDLVSGLYKTLVFVRNHPPNCLLATLVLFNALLHSFTHSFIHSRTNVASEHSPARYYFATTTHLGKMWVFWQTLTLTTEIFPFQSVSIHLSTWMNQSQAKCRDLNRAGLISQHEPSDRFISIHWEYVNNKVFITDHNVAGYRAERKFLMTNTKLWWGAEEPID